MNRIRRQFAEEVDRLCPALHETYRRIACFQRDRSDRNRERLLAQIEVVAPHLEFFAPYVPGPKQAYFRALADASLSISDRIVALDVAVGSLHVDFPVAREYMHQESEALRRALEAIAAEDAGPSDPPSDPRAWVSGLGASPGVASGPARVARRRSDMRSFQPGEVLVAPTPRPEILIGLDGIVAVVTDTGGALCHAAVIARERGIPCVVGARNATRRIRTGPLIVVDGSTGEVRRAATR